MRKLTIKPAITLLAFLIGVGTYLTWHHSHRLTAPFSSSPSVGNVPEVVAVPHIEMVSGECDQLGDARQFGLDGRAQGTIDGGVLDRKACRPTPVYPAEAIVANVSGMVTVEIIFDENGRVISAHPLSGHAMLQQAAVDAAYQARFRPWALRGESVRVRGILRYNFVLR